MLDKIELAELFEKLGIPQKGRELIAKARIEAPVRPVKSYAGNVITYLQSQKMGCEIATESRHIEFPAAIGYEYDASVLEYYPQPVRLKLEMIDTATGEIHLFQHTPDFLVIREEGITLEEWKSEEKLSRLAEKSPDRYQQTADGNWYSPQIEKQLAGLGIVYRIRSDKEISRRRVENLLYLADYFHPACPPCDPQELARLQAALTAEGRLLLQELLSAPYKFSADLLNKAIADQRVSADLDAQLLTDKYSFHLYRDATLLEFYRGHVTGRANATIREFVLDVCSGLEFEYEGQLHTVVLVSEKELVFQNQAGETHTLSKAWLLNAYEAGQVKVQEQPAFVPLNVAQYEGAELQTAMQRQALLAAGGQNRVSRRTLARWHARQKAARVNGGNEVLALVPKSADKGNRLPRLSTEQLAVMDAVVEQHWRNNRAINFKCCHRYLQDACAEAGLNCPSYPVLIQYIRRNETPAELRTRHGKRMAYQMSEFIPVLHFDTPPHGARPFQYVHMDHTQLDIELISSRTGKPLGRPWLSLAVDAFTRRVVGLYLSFDAPSYVSTMMLVRDIVRRFNRLPEFFVLDNGKDFLSDAFRDFLQVMGVSVRFRPAGNPRHGAVMERMFGRINTEYIHNLAGNTKATKNVRMTTGKHLPVNFAEWTLEAMYYGLQYWAMEHYDNEVHGALGLSPREAFTKGLHENGQRPHRHIAFNKDFLIATCPPVDSAGTRQANRQTGVKVNGFLYWHPRFREHDIAGQQWPVRSDPWDAASVYVRIKREWVHAVCRQLADLRQLTESERIALSREYEIRYKAKLANSQTPQRVKEFLHTFEPQGAMATQMQQQRETAQLHELLQGASIEPHQVQLMTRLFGKPAEQVAPTQNEVSCSFVADAADVDDELPEFDNL